ncbi:MAG: hydrogenase maturation nickel metallochaperone HypA, partial [Oscillospiraceae bacterium]
MHELSVVREALRTVDAFAKENGIDVIDTIVLQIGELSGVVPAYVEELYPAVVYETQYQNTKLKIEVEEGNAVCRKCKRVFNVIKNEGFCPHCGEKDAEVISGREFL